MTKFNVELTAECEVSFSDPDKAQDYFIDGEWKNSFYDFIDLEDMAGFLAINFLDHGGKMEGFSDFEFNDKTYESKYKEYGSIFIEVTEDLEIDCVTQSEEK